MSYASVVDVLTGKVAVDETVTVRELGTHPP